MLTNKTLTWVMSHILFWWHFVCVRVGYRRLTVKHTRTLQLEEDVLCVKFSPDHRLLAVSLLDCTVKVFYTDTLKVHHTSVTRRITRTACIQCICNCFINSVIDSVYITTEDFSLSLLQFFLSLYGHKLPVLCLDISHVSTLKLLFGSKNTGDDCLYFARWSEAATNYHFFNKICWLFSRLVYKMSKNGEKKLRRSKDEREKKAANPDV